MPFRRSVAFALLSALALLGAACSSGSKGTKATAPTSSVPPATAPAQGGVPWPAPPNPMDLARQAGLTPEPAETLVFHVHAHLDVFVNGQPVTVPAGIGIDITDPAVKTAGSGNDVSYGGISPPCAKPCISPLHTHQTDGVLHTESPTATPNTLGEFFVEWGVPLDSSCVGGYCAPATSIAIYVNGKRSTVDPKTISLADRTEIAIVIGTPPREVPKKVPF